MAVAAVGPRALETGASHSGRERNHFFLSLEGEQFKDVSGISGLDDIADGRAFTLLDFDRDGWQDVAVVNANAPLFELFRNRIGEIDGPGGAERPRAVALRFVGGNRAAEPAEGLSARDGFGARVRLDLDDMTVQREHRAGEGFAGQNSATMLIGIGERTGAHSGTVRWPSGLVQELPPLEAGTLATVYEVPSQSPTGQGTVLETYRVTPPKEPADGYASRGDDAETLGVTRSLNTDARLVMYTTMATWCIACQEEIPLLERLRATFGADELVMYGLPIDAEDDLEELGDWIGDFRPPYALLTEVADDQMAQVLELLDEELKLDGVPATILTDARGRVIRTMFGEPTISDIRAALAGLAP